jgi:hypothetical protein
MKLKELNLSDFDGCPVETLGLFLSEHGWVYRFSQNEFMVWIHFEKSRSVVCKVRQSVPNDFPSVFSGKVVACSWAVGYRYTKDGKGLFPL